MNHAPAVLARTWQGPSLIAGGTARQTGKVTGLPESRTSLAGSQIKPNP